MWQSMSLDLGPRTWASSATCVAMQCNFVATQCSEGAHQGLPGNALHVENACARSQADRMRRMRAPPRQSTYIPSSVLHVENMFACRRRGCSA